MSKPFYSIYGPSIKEFLAVKRSLGFKYQAAEYELGKFDKIALKRDEASIGITKELVVEVCDKQTNESEKSRNNRIQVVRQFAFYLNDTGHTSYVPKLPPFRSSYTPYIFTKEEVLRFFCICDQIKANNRNPRTVMFFLPVLFRLLYATGIRTGEAMSLSINDVDVERNNLKIRDSKNGKERLIPFSESLSENLQDYLKYRNQRPIVKGINHLFVHPAGGISTSYIAYKWFRKILFRSGISHQGKGAGPRVHDFRHTFAVHSLVSMCEQGLDLYYSLPILSTYLGHQSLAATDKYVRLTAEMYPSLIKSVNKVCPHIFPELNKTQYYEAD
ncbi:MAG TPA: tyrosine-type recombinase/integrase [Bacteroidales bacterium]|jgi:site-specific recombinase XerD|nr:tyrosine-type recombinase/integrase [Bacteroidales bacterium]HOU96986.1 tyrosine-type recombinase/integrase [Bacteroidales bacterium]HPX53100.1 tyrosine-type recombinase/integrase [Bacteroidales bacterium]HQG53319.1 tyrosine-type recombinase/integrase [Bacteroidales bacterium]HQL45186.1 tyrosine-type recombinase/integrase [Bacteroidales bacterium]